MSYIAIDKEYIENRIAELESLSSLEDQEHLDRSYCLNAAKYLKDILSQGIEIPVEEQEYIYSETGSIRLRMENYPNGVIIKQKK